LPRPPSRSSPARPALRTRARSFSEQFVLADDERELLTKTILEARRRPACR
jgi:hypothetical protein